MKMFKKGVVLGLVGFLVCIGISAFAQKGASGKKGSERLVAQIDFFSWIPESFKVSPDSKRVAYAAQVGKKWLVVVDGKEGKQYDGIVTIGGGKIVFDTPTNLHYLALKGDSIYLVEEMIE